MGQLDSPGQGFGTVSIVIASAIPLWCLIIVVVGGLPALAWMPLLLVFALPYSAVYWILLVVAITLGILAIRRGAGRRFGQIGLIIVAVQVIALAAFIGWALIDGAVF